MKLFISDLVREKLASKHGVTEAEIRQCFEQRGKALCNLQIKT